MPGQPPVPPPGQPGPPPQSPYGAPAPGPYGPGTGYPGAQPGYGYPGPAAPPPYPGQPGWYAQERGTNGLSIAALVTGLIPCLLFLGTIFGLVGLKQTKRRGERGRGMAIAGIVLGAVWTVLFALLVTLGVMGVFDEGNTSVEDIKSGQCFNTVGEKLSQFGTDDDDKRRTSSVDVVDCADEHDAEAFAVYEIQSGDDDPYPGVSEVSRDAQTNCSKYARTYLDGRTPSSSTRLYFYIPPADNWAEGRRTVICFFGSPDHKVTGTVKSGAGADGTGEPGDKKDGEDGDGGVGV